MAKSKKSTEEVRPVKHEQVYVELYTGDDAMTAKDWMDLLGWTVVARDQPHHFKDRHGNPVYLKNMVRNRPFDVTLAETYAYQILKKQWRFNGESVSVSKYDEVLSGNHRGVGAVLAKQIWEGAQREHWSQYWKTEPVFECVVVYGVENDDETVNTLDTGRRRSTADALFRSEMFQQYPERSKDSQGKTLPGNKRREMAKLAEYAIDFVWSRTGRKVDAFSGRARTHMDAYGFLQSHPRLLKACEHIHTEDQKAGSDSLRPISGVAVSQGVAAGMLYLMATSGDAEKAKKYLATDKDDRSEKKLDWSLWDKATSFWTDVAIGLKGKLHTALDAINEKSSATGAGQATKDERIAILARAWTVYKEGKKVTPATCALKVEHYAVREGSLHRTLKDNWVVGGIDTGDPRFQVSATQVKPKGEEKPEDKNTPVTHPETGRDADGFPSEDPAAAFVSLMTEVQEGDPSEEERAEIERAKAEARRKKEPLPVRVRRSKAAIPLDD